MDDLTRRVKTRFVSAGGGMLGGLLSSPRDKAIGMDLDRDLKDVTTSSLEAYREYAAGIAEHQRARYAEAIPYFERAVQLDPAFALAYVKIAVTSGNIGRSNDRDRYAAQALELVGRLTPRERYYIEGFFYSNSVESIGRAIAAYQRAVELYPDHSSSRTNLAQALVRVEQFEQAIRHYEVLRERGFDFPGAVGTQAPAYVTLGKPDQAVSVITDFVRRFSNLEMAHWYLGAVNLSIGRTDSAEAAYQKALELQPDFPRALAGLAQTAMLEDDWERARRFSLRRLAMPAQNVKVIGAMQMAYVSLYQGQTREAIEHLEGAAALYGSDGSDESTAAHTAIAEIRLARSEREAAAAAATRAVADARGRLSVIDALFQGSVARSAALRAEFRRLVDALPSGSSKLLPQLADAIVDIQRGRHQPGLDVIQQISPQFPPGPIDPGQAVPVRQPRTLAAYWTAHATLAAGDTEEAARQFGYVVDAGYRRLFTPIEYVRSIYYLGQIADRSGDRAKAREYYGRFLKYWKDGDIDRDKVQEALKKTS